MPLRQLRHIRWAVRATLTLGVAASVVANILHAEPDPISQCIAAWPPLALLLNIELISKVPVLHRALAMARLAATAAIAGIAAWVSYWHMAGVAARYGETGASPYLLPISVDGLVIVASICLVELAGRIRAAEVEIAEEKAAAAEQAAAGPDGMPDPVRETADAVRPRPTVTPIVRPVEFAESGMRHGAAATRAVASTSTSGRQPGAASATARVKPAGAGGGTSATANGKAAAPTKEAAPKPRRPVTETVALAAQIEAERPDLTEADIARELGITTARLRAVRRKARDMEQAHGLEQAHEPEPEQTREPEQARKREQVPELAQAREPERAQEIERLRELEPVA